ncbi:cathepsin L1-like [Ailuropoda melanoleuca]|uniref:cathepsin L1-like n=1 Tax=Ailuropoda melanoleuca TaxID=9646 RepID=UPI0014942BFF|nr:cathepsin L1-like [Ailuropoda melanoleuca]
MDNAFQHVPHNGGRDSEESDPYRAQGWILRTRPECSAADVTGPVNVPQQEEAVMLAVAAGGPVSAAIRASLGSFQFCKEGIYYDPNCSSEDLHHGVLVVGYGSDEKEAENKNYWIVKNSWGTDWGLQGYMLLVRDWDNHCEITTSFPVV